MSNDEFDNDDQPDEDGYLDPKAVARQRERIKALEKDAKALADKAAAGEAALRKLAFLEAKVDLNDPKAKFFADKYDGELDPEAVKAAAIAHGFLDAPQPEKADDLDAHQRMSETVSGGMAVGSVGDLEVQITNAKDEAEVISLLKQGGREVGSLHAQ